MKEAKEFAKKFSSIEDAIAAIDILMKELTEYSEECILVLNDNLGFKQPELTNWINIRKYLVCVEKEKAFDWNMLLSFINGRTGRKYNKINQKVRGKYKSRLREGYTKKEIEYAVNTCVKMECHKQNNYQYLTPEFFSRSDTLDKYGTPTEMVKYEYNPTA